MVRNAVENQIVLFPALCEILSGIVHDAIRPDGSDHLNISRTAYADHLGAERFGNLHRERPHASRRTVNQNFHSRLRLPFLT